MTDVAGFHPKPGGGQYTALTPYFNPAATNVSGPLPGNTRSLSVRRLLPPSLANTNIPVFVHYMPWFFQGSSEHVATGYESDKADVIVEHLRDIGARDFDGVIIDWNGLAKPREDLATLRVRDNIAGKTNVRNAQLKFALMLDQGMYVGSGNCGGVPLNQQVICVQGKIEQNLIHADNNYLRNANYLTSTGPGAPEERPVLFTFLQEDGRLHEDQGPMFGICQSSPCELPRPINGQPFCNSSADCWDKIWRGSLEYFASQRAYRPIMVFRNSGIFPPEQPPPPGVYVHFNGIRHTETEGMYAWVTPSDHSRPFITDETQRPNAAAFPNLWGFYREAFCTLAAGISCAAFIEDSRTKASVSRIGMRATGTAFKGFDNYLAPFDQLPTIKAENHRVLEQGCGRTWLDSWEQISVPSQTVGDQLKLIQVATWNDYDEGTAIEMGIENCVTIDAVFDRNASQLIWYTENTQLYTLEHFEVFVQRDGESTLTWITDFSKDAVTAVIDPNVSSEGSRPARPSRDGSPPYRPIVAKFVLDVPNSLWAGYPLSYFYVKAVARPGLTNKMSDAAPTDITLSLSRPSRPSRTSSGQLAFLDPVGPIPEEDQYQEPPPDDPPPPPPGDCNNPNPSLPPMECEINPS